MSLGFNLFLGNMHSRREESTGQGHDSDQQTERRIASLHEGKQRFTCHIKQKLQLSKHFYSNFSAISTIYCIFVVERGLPCKKVSFRVKRAVAHPTKESILTNTDYYDRILH